MIDPTAVVYACLLATTGVTSAVASDLETGIKNIWGERTVPIPNYRPSQGGAIAFRARGGPATDYHGQTFELSFQFKCYGTTEAQCNTVYRALFDALQDRTYGNMIHSELEIGGQSVRERAMEPNDWPYVLAFFTMIFRTN
jgi:hypothetical protein